jgi:menaquinone-dependent protoporphyrinogen oxidase
MMAADVLIVYASKHGSTEQVARGIGEKLRGLGLTTAIEPAGAVEDLSGHRAVLLGGSIYMGRWHHDARLFLRRHRRALERVPFAVFALGPGKNTPKDFESSRHQLEHALAKTPELEPRAVAVFGGVIDPERLRFPFSRMPKADLRDWDEIRRWASTLPAELDLELVEHHRELVPF